MGEKYDKKTLEKYGFIFNTDDFIDVSDVEYHESTKEEADALDFAKDKKDQIHLYYPTRISKEEKKRILAQSKDKKKKAVSKKSTSDKPELKSKTTQSTIKQEESFSALSDVQIIKDTISEESNSYLNQKYSQSRDDLDELNKKYESSGFDNFSEVEIIRIILGNTVDRDVIYNVSNTLLETFGSLQSILQADVSDLVIAGLSQDAAHAITRHREMERYLKMHSPTKCHLGTIDDVGKFCCDHFGHDVVESFYVISLDSCRNVKACTLISKGIEHRTEAYPVSVMRAVLRQRASMVILCHNHPGGNITPSNEDILTTQNIADVLRKIEIPLIDHIICYKDKFISLFERCSINF